LPFAPKLNLKLAGAMKRTGTPRLTATLTGRPGDANIGTATVTMPRSIFLDNAHINGPCTRVQFAANACPASSVLGTARAITPILAAPLEGPVYLMSGFGHSLPDLVVALKGQLNFNLDGRISSVHQRLRTTFEGVPDVPVTKFTMKLVGGKRGLLENSENLCATRPKAQVGFRAQNGKRLKRAIKLRLPCKSKSRRQTRHKRLAARTVG
jgi:hypothetical protein